jgi:hypothetical protein
MDERRKWKNVNNEEGRKNYRRMRNEFKRATNNAKKEYLDSICDEIIEFLRRGRYDLMYMKTKELVWKELYDRANRSEHLEVEIEVDQDEKGPYILQSEVEKAIKEIRGNKATGDDDVPGDVLKLLGEDGLRLMTQLINSIYVTGEWPRDFIEVTMIALKKKPKTTKCSDHRTCSKDNNEDT